MMPQRLEKDVYRSIGVRSALALKRSAPSGEDTIAIRQSVRRLRYLHVPVTLLVLRVREKGADNARRLLSDRLSSIGTSGILPNGDIAMLYIGSPDANRNGEVEGRVLELVSRQLMAFVVCGMDVRCRAAFAHFWSDEIWDAPDIVNLATSPAIAMVDIRPAAESGRVARFDSLN